MHNKHDDKLKNELIGICQYFARQNFPNPDSSIFFIVKILCYTVRMQTVIAQQISNH